MVTARAVQQGLNLLAELKNTPKFDADRLGRWELFFSDWTDERFVKACAKAGGTLTFFPTPGELRAVDAGNAEERATLAWEAVRSMIRRYGSEASFTSIDVNGDGHALWAVSRMGAECIGMMTDDDRPIRAAEFRRLYAAATSGGFWIDYLAGVYETQNRARGLDVSRNPAMLGRPDGIEHPQLGNGRSLPEGDGNG